MYDVIIVGAGPAGASAALFTAKAGKKTLVLDNDQSMTKAAWVENHYGVSEIEGPELLKTGQEQAKKFGAEIVQTQVNQVKKENPQRVTVETEKGSYEAEHVILTTGGNTKLAEASGINTTEGTEPRIKTIIDTDDKGKTNVEGVWAAGTVAGVSVHTIITAGDGAKAAINVLTEMNGERYVDHDILSKK
ncbi:Pyridine nucleotide-disulphide oxidoreductase [Alteribacillus persepolensis]|uniref:Pyridine nucleotide-disulphide oxidoreductase n=1 Tax=Alteribacillus persepolensis TaxID=568899 RepID=A0A1G8AAI8_9BACI|nr:FAD-dependent oxidoreductase [Alteribacillus persepolensis]SDH17952.1 Pyridine nucleotide-disulphide oxidoreductase [Alteribacillus persepolensis]